MSNGGVQQSGNVTPGHGVIWTAPGVVGDAGPMPTQTRVLGSLRGASFSSTFDQPILIPAVVAAFRLVDIIVTNATQQLNVAVGGFYSGANKGGQQIVAPTQAYAALTSPQLLMRPTLTTFAQNTRFSQLNLPLILVSGVYMLALYLSLTTGQASPAALADVYITGTDLT